MTDQNPFHSADEGIYCCEEHVEYALEEVINEKEMPPIFQRLESGKLSTNPCAYCGKPSVYIVSNGYSPTKCG